MRENTATSLKGLPGGRASGFRAGGEGSGPAGGRARRGLAEAGGVIWPVHGGFQELGWVMVGNGGSENEMDRCFGALVEMMWEG